MTDNQQRAVELLPDAVRLHYPDVLDDIAAALDEAEARGRADVAAKVEALVIRHIGYGMTEVSIESLRGVVSRYLA